MSAAAFEFPKIIYGTAWKAERTSEYVVKAVLQGFRAIDTACQPKHYREDLVGEALDILYEKHGIKRSDIFLQTKFTGIEGQDRSKPLPYNPNDSVPRQVQASFAKSMRNLRTERIDAILLHSPLATPELTLAAWRELITLRQSGNVSLIGISNVYDMETLEYLFDATGVKPDIVQNRWYNGDGWDKEVVKYCQKEAIYYESFWTLTGSPLLLRHPSVLALSETARCTPAQVIYRLAQDIGITPLAGSTDEDHMKHGVQAQSLPLFDSKLSADVLQIIS